MTQVVIQHDWSVVGLGGHVGVFQYQTGSGVMDAGTAIMLGSMHFTIPLPMLAIVGLGCLMVLAALWLIPETKTHEKFTA